MCFPIFSFCNCTALVLSYVIGQGYCIKTNKFLLLLFFLIKHHMYTVGIYSFKGNCKIVKTGLENKVMCNRLYILNGLIRRTVKLLIILVYSVWDEVSSDAALFSLVLGLIGGPDPTFW